LSVFHSYAQFYDAKKIEKHLPEFKINLFFFDFSKKCADFSLFWIFFVIFDLRRLAMDNLKIGRSVVGGTMEDTLFTLDLRANKVLVNVVEVKGKGDYYEIINGAARKIDNNLIIDLIDFNFGCLMKTANFELTKTEFDNLMLIGSKELADKNYYAVPNSNISLSKITDEAQEKLRSDIMAKFDEGAELSSNQIASVKAAERFLESKLAVKGFYVKYNSKMLARLYPYDPSLNQYYAING
jgi:hypothetical protein